MIKSIDENDWCVVIIRWERPTINVSKVKTPKSELIYTTKEEKLANANSKALNAIFCAVDDEEFKRIFKCIIPKKAWDILETTHEWANTTK